MVSAAKLRRAQDAILAARPVRRSRSGRRCTSSAAGSRELSHPLLRVRPEPKRLEVLVIASDRGLCGAFNANVLKAGAGDARRARAAVRAGERLDGRPQGGRVRAPAPAARAAAGWSARACSMTLVREIAQYLAEPLRVGRGGRSGGRGERVRLARSRSGRRVVRLLPLVPEESRVRSYADDAGREPFDDRARPERAARRARAAGARVHDLPGAARELGPASTPRAWPRWRAPRATPKS